jgi:hypothetical protein
MKKIKYIFFYILLSNSAFSQIMSFGQTKIEEGTIIIVKSMSNITSKTIMYGELIDFACADDTYVDNKLVIKKNSNVRAKIENIDRAKGLGKEGTLKIKFNKLTTIDGQEIPIEAVYGTSQGKNITEAAVNLSVFFSPFFLLLKGKEAKIPIGSLMEVYTTKEFYIKTK